MRTLNDLVGDVISLAIAVSEKSRFRQSITDLLLEVDGISLAWISVLDDDQSVVPVAASGEAVWYVDEVQINLSDTQRRSGPTGLAFQTKEPQYFDDVNRDPRLEPWRESANRAGIVSGMSLPLLLSDELIGTLNCYSNQPDFFDSSKRDLLRIISDAVTLSWETFETREVNLRSTLQISGFDDPYFRALEQAPAGILVLDAIGSVHRYNDALNQIMGTPKRPPRTIEEIFENQKSREIAIEGVLRVSTDPRSTRRSTEPLLIRGTARAGTWVQCTFARIHIARAEEDRILCVIIDVSGPRRVQANLTRNRRMLDKATENTPMIVFHADEDRKIHIDSGSLNTEIERIGELHGQDFISQSTLVRNKIFRLDKLLRQGRLDGDLTRLGSRTLATWARFWSSTEGPPKLVGTSIDVTELETARGAAERAATLSASLVSLARNALVQPEMTHLYQGVAAEIVSRFPDPHLFRIRVDARNQATVLALETSEASQGPMTFSVKGSKSFAAAKSAIGPLAYDLPDDDPLWQRLTERSGPFNSAMVVPVSSRHGVKELLVVALTRHGQFSSEELGYFSSICNLLSAAWRRQEAQHLMVQMGKTDPTTGLEIYHAFVDALSQALGSEDFEGLTILGISLVGFGDLSDHFGHKISEVILKKVVSTLRSSSLRMGKWFVVGPSEFALLCSGQPPAGLDLRSFIGDLHTTLTRPVEIRGALYIPQSVATVTEVEQSLGIRPSGAELAAMVESQLREANFAQVDIERVYQVSPSDFDGIEIAAGLSSALSNQVLELYYQPKLRLATSKVDSFEALVRWKHPQLGFVSPDRFIPLAESLGLIDAITEIVVEQALIDIKRFHQLDPDLRVSVNLSQETLSDLYFLVHLTKLAEERSGPLPFSSIVFEITETTVLDDPSRASAALEILSRGGASFSLDDFGTGYTSLSHLASLALSELKIDRSFVSEMTTSPSRLALVQAAVSMGRALDLDTVAEGVETQAQLDALKAMGCSHGQGYFIAQPMNLESALSWHQSFPERRSLRD